MSLIDNIIAPFKFPKEILAVEYCNSGGGEYYSVSHLKVVKSEVELISSKNSDRVKFLLEGFDSKLPIFLMINGKRVLSKKLPYKVDLEAEQLIRQAFPSVPLESLSHKLDVLNENKAIISVIRKDLLENIIKPFEEEGFKIVDYTLSAYSLMELSENFGEEEVQLGSLKLNGNEQSISLSNELLFDEIEILGEKVERSNALSFLFGVSLLSSQMYASTDSRTVFHRKDWQFHQMYKKGLIIGMSFMFGVLLISFFVYNNYFDKNKKLALNTQSYDSQLKMVQQMQEAYDTKIQFLEVNGSSGSSFSKMADQIASVVPKGIVLRELSIYPLEKRLKKQNLVRFYNGEIIVGGETKNYGQFQKWFKALEEFNWVEDIDVVGYQETNNSHRAEFSITIEIRE